MTKTAIDASEPDDAFSIAGRRAFELLTRAAEQWRDEKLDPLAVVVSLQMAEEAVDLAMRAAVVRAREAGHPLAEIEIAIGEDISYEQAIEKYSGDGASLE